MNRSLLLVCLAFVVAAIATTAAAQAQATRTWVSGVGDDNNPCSRTAPCKTWAGAINKTVAGGEIDALDPGGFGALTITKAITLDGGGGQVASVLVSGTQGIAVAAGTNDVVNLRNLRFQGLEGSPDAAGLNGINITSVGAVNIENCTITGFGQAGINFAPNARAWLTVTHTVLENNQGGGVVITGGAAYGVRATIDDTDLLGNWAIPSGVGDGVSVTNYARVSISNSVITDNQDGVFSTGTKARVIVNNSQVENNTANGLHASGGSGIAVTGSSIFANFGYGVLGDTSGSVSTYGNNAVYQNNLGPGTFATPNLSPSNRYRNEEPRSEFRLTPP